jgi:hypothetical protein
VSGASFHERSDETITDASEANGESRPSSIRITVVVQNRWTFDTRFATGRQIKETANVPAGFALFRRVQQGNEPIPDDTETELRNGDHFFARPPVSSSQHVEPRIHRER